ncbi:MAG TPA: HAMP domain-containing protein, partial [Alphaproteobacteria bacterium]|nr:HAMP domain-containing protein [Alphaproteobacteria bacterium]
MLFQLALKNMLPRSLFGRSLLIIVMPLIILQLVSTWIFYDRHWDTITRRLSTAIAGDIGQTLELMQRSTGEDSRDAIFDMAARNFQLQITIREGEVIPPTDRSGNARIDYFLSRALSGRVQRPFRIDSSDFKERVIVDLQLKDAVMTIVVPGKRLFSTTTYIFLMWMVGTSLVVFAVASIFMRNQVRPIRRLAAAADAFGKGRDTAAVDFKPEGALEVRQAAAAFNLMRARLRRQFRQRTDMLSGVSHDLRTPITRMKLQLAMLPDSPEVSDLKH